MNILFRVLLIISVAAVIAGAIFIAVNGVSTATTTAPFVDGGRRGEFRPGGGPDDNGVFGGIVSVLDWVKNVIVIGIVAAAYLVVARRLPRARLLAQSI